MSLKRVFENLSTECMAIEELMLAEGKSQASLKGQRRLKLNESIALVSISIRVYKEKA